MFGRASKLSSCCFRCQKRFADQHRLWRSPIVSFSTANGHRLQNAAAVETNDDEPPQESSPPDVQGEPESNKRTAERNSVNPTKYRRWRPHNAEDLGVEVLGKPAEVLILPTRDRKVKHENLEEEEHDTKVNIHESLNSELRPISATEVSNNIDSMKTELEEDVSNLTVDKWNNIRRRLADGFTKSQLQEYLRVTTGQAQWSAKEVYSPTNSQKRKLAEWIMIKAWGWTCIEDATAVEQKHTELVARKSIEVMPLKLEFLLLDQKQPLKQISERFGVQVDVFKSAGKVEFSGPAEAVGSAAAHLRSIVKEIQVSSLPITQEIAKLSNNDAEMESSLAKLTQKHNTLIRKDKQLFRMVGYVSTDADAVLRDLLVMADRPYAATESTIWRSQPQEETSKVPIYPREIPHWLHESHMWYRHVSTSTTEMTGSSSTEQDGQAVSKWLRNLSKSDRMDQERFSLFDLEPSTLKHGYTADLGQILFTEGNVDQGMRMKTLDQKASKVSLLSPYRALLPQALSRKDFRMAEIRNDGNDNTARPFLLLLRLRPIARDITCPPFEILLRGGDLSRGLRQQLEIRKAVAVLDQWQHHLLLPHQPVDIRITRRSELDLLRGVTSTSIKGYLHILKQLGAYLEHAQESNEDSFAAIWSLNVTPLLKKDHAAASLRKNERSSLSVTRSGDIADQSSESEAASNSGSRYILDPPEYLDVTTCTSSSLLGDRYLEHISCDAGQAEKPAQRQILRIVQTPLVELLNGEDKNHDKSTFANSINISKGQGPFQETVGAAYNIATLLASLDRSPNS